MLPQRRKSKLNNSITGIVADWSQLCGCTCGVCEWGLGHAKFSSKLRQVRGRKFGFLKHRVARKAAGGIRPSGASCRLAFGISDLSATHF